MGGVVVVKGTNLTGNESRESGEGRGLLPSNRKREKKREGVQRRQIRVWKKFHRTNRLISLSILHILLYIHCLYIIVAQHTFWCYEWRRENNKGHILQDHPYCPL